MNLFNFLQKERIPTAYQWYQNELANSNQKQLVLEQTRFVVLDTETTGLNPKEDRILSIGGVAVNGYNIDVTDSFEVYLKQERVGAEAISVHEITPQASAKGLEPKVALDQFLHWAKGSIIIGHYVDFDFKILSNACKRNLGFKLRNKRYDTMQMLKRVDNHFAQNSLNKPEDWGLDKLCQRYNLPMADRHTAPGDALATALLFARLLKKLEHRGVKTLGDLLAR